jgi:sigma-B regulation protein RsbU (phosphoserine phosphatase)
MMAPNTDSPAEILERINHFYIHNIRFTTFVTVFLARYDPNNRTLAYVNSGHNPPAVFRRSSAGIDWLTRTAPAIGLAEEYFPRTETVKLSAGDVLLLYTDGITEALNMDMEEFGMERLAGFIQNAADLTATDMLQVVRQGISAYSGDVPLADDLTLVALKVSE